MKELEDKKSSKGRKRGADSDDDTEEAAGVRRRIKGKPKYNKMKKKRWYWFQYMPYFYVSRCLISFLSKTPHETYVNT